MKLLLSAMSAAVIGGVLLAYPAMAEHSVPPALRLADPADGRSMGEKPDGETHRVISRVVGSAFMLNRDGTVFTGE